MTHPRDYPPVLDRIGAALEAACDALITLQSIDGLSRIPDEAWGEEHVAAAVSHLRHAIDELRDAQAEGQSGLSLGFVLARGPANSNGNRRTPQSSPRRTA